MTRNAAETLIGAIVLIVAVGFFYFAYTRSDIGAAVDGYTVTAKFTGVGTLSPGADVRLSGIKIGNVVTQTLDPVTYLAEVTLTIDDQVKLPTDTTAQISSEGLLGGAYVKLEPGGEEVMLGDGDEIQFTQAAADIVGLLTQLVFSQGSAN